MFFKNSTKTSIACGSKSDLIKENMIIFKLGGP
jgi:hypothetical protein